VPDVACDRRGSCLAASFVRNHVEAGAKVITDGWQGYHGLEKLGYVHERRSQRAARTAGEDSGELLPRCASGRFAGQAVAAGTHQGAVLAKTLSATCVFQR